MFPWVFAYDRYNYAHNLKSLRPEIYREFLNGNFAVQQSITNTFEKLEPDKVMETTINKDTKSPGGTAGMITYF